MTERNIPTYFPGDLHWSLPGKMWWLEWFQYKQDIRDNYRAGERSFQYVQYDQSNTSMHVKCESRMPSVLKTGQLIETFPNTCRFKTCLPLKSIMKRMALHCFKIVGHYMFWEMLVFLLEMAHQSTLTTDKIQMKSNKNPCRHNNRQTISAECDKM